MPRHAATGGQHLTQFAFLQREWPMVFGAASKAEAAVRADPRTACFYARRALEIVVGWTYKRDPALRLPYRDSLSALIHEPSFKDTAGEAVFNKARVIVTLGNRLYASPFTGVSARGPEALFVQTELDALLRSLDAVKASAVVA